MEKRRCFLCGEVATSPTKDFPRFCPKCGAELSFFREEYLEEYLTGVEENPCKNPKECAICGNMFPQIACHDIEKKEK